MRSATSTLARRVARTFVSCTLVLSFGLLTRAGHAQSSRPLKADDPAAPTVVLASEPTKIDALGISLFLPEGATASVENMQSTAAATITPATPEGVSPVWSLIISNRATTNASVTPVDIIDATIKQLVDQQVILDQDGKPIAAQRNEVGLLERTPETGQPAPLLVNGSQQFAFARCYVAVPPARGDRPIIRGVTAVKISPKQFLLFELYTTDLEFKQSARKAYEVIVASTTYDDQAVSSVDRQTLVETTKKLFENVPFADWVALAKEQPERWERMYRPATNGNPSDDTEVGYRRIQVREGARGEVDKRIGKGAAGDTGLIVRMDARFVEGGQIIDSASIFFVSKERTAEVWSIVMKVVSDKAAKPVNHSETGAREETLMTIRVESEGKPAKTVTPQIAGDGYMSRVEAFMLPAMLVKKGIPAIYGSYAYQSQVEKVAFRRDVLEQPKEEGKPWKLTTRLVEGQPEQTSEFNADGTLIRTRLPNGILSEPTSGQKLLALWRQKGLPIN
jgi:hypothetical protein